MRLRFPGLFDDTVSDKHAGGDTGRPSRRRRKNEEVSPDTGTNHEVESFSIVRPDETHIKNNDHSLVLCGCVEVDDKMQDDDVGGAHPTAIEVQDDTNILDESIDWIYLDYEYDQIYFLINYSRKKLHWS